MEFESHTFPTFSIYCIYKNDFTSNFSKLKFFPSLFYHYLFYSFLVFEPYIVFCTNTRCFPGDGSGKEHSCQFRRYKKPQV